MLASFRSVVRAKAAENSHVTTRDSPVTAESADAAVTALLSGIMVSTFEADPRLGFDSATHSRTLMFSGDESNAYSVGFEFDFVEHRGREFRDVRARFFGTAAEHSDIVASEVIYCQSLQAGLTRAASTGKSKADFFRTNDNRLLIKSIKEEEYNALLVIMGPWMEHVRENPSTLLVTVLGMYVVQTARITVRYLVMENVGLGSPIGEVLDIKGSLVGRKTNERADAFEFEIVDPEPLQPDAPYGGVRRQKSANGGTPPLLKDVDLLERREQVFKFGPALREQFFDQLTKDATFLGAAQLMDYSLLVLVADPAQVAMHASSLPYTPSEWSYFRRFNGAVCGTDDDDNVRQDVCYFMAIIDFAQPFNVRKRVESLAKSLVHDVNELSAVEPQFYATRLIQFAQRLSDQQQMQQLPIVSANSSSGSLLPDIVERI
jgi:1-phosphatidylinositol-4-phosphate 5-kinase